MKKITNQNYAEALYDLTKDIPETQIKEVVAEFTKLLMRHHKLFETEAIMRDYLKIKEQAEGSYVAKIITTHPLTHTLRKNIQTSIGSNVEIEEQINPGILGGIIIQTPDTIFDASIKTQLLKLKQVLVK